MEFDPLSRDVPPSRHAIESDSEESEDELEIRQRKVNEKVSFKIPSFSLRSTNSNSSGQASTSYSKPLTIFVGSIGESYVRSNDSLTESLALISEDDTEQQGSIYISQSESTIALIHPDSKLISDQANLSFLSRFILSSLRPSKVIIIDEYHPALYLSEKDPEEEIQNDVQPIRILHSSQPSLSLNDEKRSFIPIHSFKAPNYITGLGAALLTESTFNNVPSSLVLVPQQKSINPHLQMLQRIPQASSSIFERPEILDSEMGDSLTALLGLSNLSKSDAKPLDNFLHQRRSDQRKRQQNEISAMYM